MKTLGVWLYEELLPIIELNRKDKVILPTPNYGDIPVRVSGPRLTLLKRNPKCVKCGKVGVLWALEQHTFEPPHLNLYALSEPNGQWKKVNYGGLLLMTQDHIIPKSKDGSDGLYNLQTMCALCNFQKGSRMPPLSKKVKNGCVDS